MAVKEKVKQEEKTEAKAEAPKVEKVRAAVKEVVSIKASAISADIGPTVLAGLDKAYKDEAKAQELLQAVEGKRYDLLSQLTNGILKAATADPSIDLTVAFAGDATKMNVLNDQLGLALGFREVTVMPATDKVQEIRRIGPAKGVAKYFPGPKDDKNTAEYKRKNTLRSNFLHMVKKCAQAASGIMASGTSVAVDKQSGTLRLSGPAITKTFGADSVVLNEKQVIGEGDAAVKLTAKPSFTAVAKMGAEAAGKPMTTRKQITTPTDPAGAVMTIAKSLADACGKLKLPANDDVKRALSVAQSAIDKVLQAK